MIETQKHLKSLPETARELLSLIGENPAREELRKTPERFAKAISELTAGYSMDAKTITNGALYPSQGTEGLIIVRDIAFYSLCEHHLLPFHGKIQVGYTPNDKIIGLSKIPRIVQVFSRRLQLQERLTRQIAQAIQELLNPSGVAVVANGRHMCLEMRGAKANNAEMVTSFYLGKLKDDPSFKSEFLTLIRKQL